MTSLLFRQVRLLEPRIKQDRIADVLVVDGQIQQVADRLTEYPAEAVESNGQGLILAPGLVDLHSHSCEPGAEDQETLKLLLQSARAGGFVQIGILPTTQPPIDNSALVNKLQSLYQQVAGELDRIPQVRVWGALTQGVAGEQLADLNDLAQGGVVGFADGCPIDNQQLLRRLLEYLQPYQQPIMLWPLDRKLAGNGSARQGAASLRLGLVGSPASSEAVAVAAILEMVAAIGTPIHLMRISTARSVQLIAAAKRDCLPITASTTWMHLLGNTETLANYDSNWRLDPPVGNANDQIALVQAIAEGVIEAIAIDHRAYSYEDKKVAFGEAPSGAIGLQIALPLLWQKLVCTGQLTALQLWSALSHQPANCWGQAPPSQLILFDPSVEWVVDASQLWTVAHNTPWFNQTISGRVEIL